MRKLQNTLYVTESDARLSLEGKSIVVKQNETKEVQVPLLNLEQIVCFTYCGASPALMAACVDNHINLTFISPQGKFMARITGKKTGNILLRLAQYRMNYEQQDVRFAAAFLTGKLYNSRKVLQRAIRDHGDYINKEEVSKASTQLQILMRSLNGLSSTQDLMACEGSAAKTYFNQFNHLILQQKESFPFNGRSRRPPLDNMNALLSFLYTLLTNEVFSALETVGLDPYIGFLHAERPGRPSLALDLMEELRPVFADRLALSLVNRKQISASGFVTKENGAILMDTETRKIVLRAWQEKKMEEITHPFLKEKVEFGLVPYVQALLLARCIRGDIDAYPPFFWS